MKLEGKVWRYGDNIDTDVIIPARYLNTFDPKELASHCMVDIDESFAPNVKAGDIMVGGRNFGCGSSREHAPWALEMNGINVVIAENFARIFRQNMFNCGLLAIELPAEKIAQLFDRFAGQVTELAVDLDGHSLSFTCADRSEKLAFTISSFDEALVRAGGWVDYADQKY